MVLSALAISLWRHTRLSKKDAVVPSPGMLAITIPGFAFAYWMVDKVAETAQFAYNLSVVEEKNLTPALVNIERTPFVPWTKYTVHKKDERPHVFRVFGLPCINSIENSQENWSFAEGIFLPTTVGNVEKL